jgi:hypothetical protein
MNGKPRWTKTMGMLVVILVGASVIIITVVADAKFVLEKNNSTP